MRVLITIAYLLMCCGLSATDYYVDFTLGNDANDGLTPQTAWKTAGKVRSVNNQVGPGDRFLFKRGETWPATRIYYTESGTAAAPIIFSDYGNPSLPLPVISAIGNVPAAADAANWTATGNGIWALALPYSPSRLLLNGTEVLRSNTLAELGQPDNVGAVGIWFYDLNNQLLLVFSPNNPASNFTSIEGGMEPAALQLDGCTGISIKNIELQGGRVAALQLFGAQHVSLTNCIIGHLARNGVNVTPQGNGTPCREITIQANTISSGFSFQYGLGSDRGVGDGINLADAATDVLIEGNTFTNWAHNAIELLGDCSACVGVNRVRVLNNAVSAPDIPYAHPIGMDGILDKCRDNEVTGNNFSECRTASQINGNNNLIRYNLIRNQRQTTAKADASAHGITLAIYGSDLVCQDNRYEFNLIYDTDESGFLIRNYGHPNNTVQGNIIQNNIIVNGGLNPYQNRYPVGTGVLIHSGFNVGNNTIRNNLYFNTNGLTVAVYDPDLGTSFTFDQFNQQNGVDGNTVSGNIDGNPLLADLDGGDYTPQASSPVINAAVSTSSALSVVGPSPDIGPVESDGVIFFVEVSQWFPSIAAAVAAVPAGTAATLEIPAGSYLEPIDTEDKEITVRIISGG